MVKTKDPGEYINGEFVKSCNVTELTILTECDIVDGDFGKKMEGKVRCNDKDRTEKIISLNKTNHRKLIELFGDETADWKDKTVRVKTEPGHMNGKEYTAIYIIDKV